MKILITGGRDYRSQKGVYEALDAWHQMNPITLLIHGKAKGADTLAGSWAASNGLIVVEVPAPWNYYGVSAGTLRNRAMLLLKPDYVIAFPGGVGTRHMKTIAKEAGLYIWEPYL